MRSDVILVSHAFGVHSLDIGEWIELLASAMSRDKATERKARHSLADIVKQAPGTQVSWELDTFSPEEK